MSMTSLRAPLILVAAVSVVLAAIGSLTAEVSEGSARAVAVGGSVLALVAAPSAIVSLLRGFPVVTVAMALLLAVAHGTLMSPQIGASGQPSLGIVGVASALLLIVAGLDVRAGRGSGDRRAGS